jgi:hypothetical protein
MRVPESWDEGDINFKFNDSSWCVSNVIEDIVRREEILNRCPCFITEAKYIGEATEEDEKTYQDAIAYLAYDMLYGENLLFGGVKPYEKQPMRMGTIPITTDGIKVMGNAVYVQGNGFTEKSKIFIKVDCHL